MLLSYLKSWLAQFSWFSSISKVTLKNEKENIIDFFIAFIFMKLTNRLIFKLFLGFVISF